MSEEVSVPSEVTHKSKAEQWLEVLRHTAGNNAHEEQWKAAEAVYALWRAGYSLAQIRRLTGIKLDASGISRLRIAFEFYCVEHDLCYRAKKLPLHTLYMMRPLFTKAQATGEQISRILKKIQGMEREDALEYARKALGLKEKKARRTTLSVTEQTHRQLKDMRAQLEKAIRQMGYGAQVRYDEVIKALLWAQGEPDVKTINAMATYLLQENGWHPEGEEVKEK